MSKPQNKQETSMPISKSKLWQSFAQRLSIKSPTDAESTSYHTVDKILRDVIEIKLSMVTSYHSNQTSRFCLEIVIDVLKAIGKKTYDRYKIVTQVHIIQRDQQSLHAAFQYLWDAERDNYSYHVFENNHIYAWCCVFGVYYD
ncbi:dynein light chain Tctex-type 5 [Cardiocondyla obscurior]|uniref:dynein light chain Tctex-type 5 n=1 Tax=Cardiocondyla obscurior TaxID=286306 RepID=UPI0039656367